jgi:hypothetical protein
MGEMDLHEHGCKEMAPGLQRRDRQFQSKEGVHLQSMSDMPSQQAAGKLAVVVRCGCS